jgi:hypothetical protein
VLLWPKRGVGMLQGGGSDGASRPDGEARAATELLSIIGGLRREWWCGLEL